MGTDCKHTVALLLVARDVAHGIMPQRPGSEGADGANADDARAREVRSDGDGSATDGSAGGGSAAPGAEGAESVGRGPAAGASPTDQSARAEVHWAELLGHVRPRTPTGPAEAQARPEPQGDLMPAGLFVDTIYRDPRGARAPASRAGGPRGGLPVPGFGLRPTRWTRAGAWHRTLSWHDALPQWRAGIRLLPEHERILSRIHDATRHASGNTTYFTPVPPISLDASPDIWPLLVEAIGAGVK